MKFRLFGARAMVFGVALIVGIVAGTLGIHYTTAHAGSNYAFPKNNNGQTYGSSAKATSLDSLPDLISAVGVGGVSGYVKRSDAYPPLPKTPQEAIALTKDNTTNPEHAIPLYAVDGKTVIGKFIVGGGEEKEFTTLKERQEFDNEIQNATSTASKNN